MGTSPAISHQSLEVMCTLEAHKKCISHEEALVLFDQLFKSKSATVSNSTSSQDFCANTTVHGLRYLRDGQHRAMDRRFWFLAVVISFGLGVSSILELWREFQENNISMTYCHEPIPVSEIPFPAVTICSEAKMNIEVDLPECAHGMGQYCDDPKLVAFVAKCKNSATLNVTQTVEDLRSTQLINYLKACKISGVFCAAQMVKSVLTDDGYCFSFNLWNQDEILEQNAIQMDYPYVTDEDINGSRNVSTPPVSNLSYPSRQGKGSNLAVNILLQINKKQFTGPCQGPVEGFKVHLHLPYEMPRLRNNYFRVPFQKRTMVTINPNITTTSLRLQKYDVNRRQCYVPSERKLIFFKNYTKQNCELECISEYTLIMCGCVRLHSPRNKNTSTCSIHMKDCMDKAEDHFNDHGEEGGFTYSFALKSQVYFHACICHPPCSSITYEPDYNVWDLFEIKLVNAFGIFANRTDQDTQAWLTLYLKDGTLFASSRTELYGRHKFIANCGGILGLYMGVSLISVVEIVYYIIRKIGAFGHSMIRNNSFH